MKELTKEIKGRDGIQNRQVEILCSSELHNLFHDQIQSFTREISMLKDYVIKPELKVKTQRHSRLQNALNGRQLS